MKKNEEYTIAITDDTNLGYGIAKIKNQVVFVPKVMKDEVVRMAITKVKKKYAFARVIEIINPVKERVKPKCTYSQLCGGCQLQHMNYQAQLDFKYRHLTDLMKDETIRYPIGMENPYYYRNKAQFPVQIKNHSVIMGLYRPHSHDIVACTTCMIQSKPINDIYQFLQKELTVDLGQGLRHILIRYSRQGQVVFIGSKRNHWKPLVNKLVDAFPAVTSVIFNLNMRKDNVILGNTYEVLYGNDFIMEECLSKQVKVHFKSFFQVNHYQMEVLYRTAIQFADLQKNMSVIELYAGTGTIGMIASRYVHEVIGVEISEEAVENARESCRINDIHNCTYVCQDVSEFAHNIKNTHKKIDVLFVDPPRKGMTKQGIEDIVTIQPKTVIYISCNPQTLARDLQIYKGQGYLCECIQPVDMFCQTTGLECVAKFVKID